jgi:hypothetical protein
MPDDFPPWEPPFAGSETEHLLAAWDRLRVTFRWKADGLDAAGLAATLGPSRLTLGGLLKHLAAQEDHNATVKLTGEPLDAVWDDNGWDEDDDWEFTSAADDSPEELYALYDAAVLRARDRWNAVIEQRGLDGEAAASFGPGRPASVRRLLCDMLEEYGRHTGQADLLREAVDGRTGEDPPSDWRSPIVP